MVRKFNRILRKLIFHELSNSIISIKSIINPSCLSIQSIINIVRKGNYNMVYITQIGVHTTAVINVNGRFLISNDKNNWLYNVYIYIIIKSHINVTFI